MHKENTPKKFPQTHLKVIFSKCVHMFSLKPEPNDKWTEIPSHANKIMDNFLLGPFTESSMHVHICTWMTLKITVLCQMELSFVWVRIDWVTFYPDLDMISYHHFARERSKNKRLLTIKCCFDNKIWNNWIMSRINTEFVMK